MNRRVNRRILVTANVTIDSDSFLNFMRTVNFKTIRKPGSLTKVQTINPNWI